MEGLTNSFKFLASAGIITLVIRYLITFLNSKLSERRIQRKELQYLHNSLFFILIVIFFPFTISFVLVNDFFPNLINDYTIKYFIILLTLFVFLQIINYIFVSFSNKIDKPKSKVALYIKRHKPRLLAISLLIALICSLLSTIFVLLFIENSEKEYRISGLSSLFIIYSYLFIPYYVGVKKMFNREVLVTIHLKNGDVLSNLIISHRTFGKDLIFYGIKDNAYQQPVIIPKDNIQFMFSAEHPTDEDISKTKNKLKTFASRVLNLKDSKS